jgi:hypothetical protein
MSIDDLSDAEAEEVLDAFGAINWSADADAVMIEIGCVSICIPVNRFLAFAGIVDDIRREIQEGRLPLDKLT